MKVSKLLFSKSFIISESEKLFSKKIVQALAPKSNKLYAALGNSLNFTNDFPTNVETTQVSIQQVESFVETSFKKGVDGVVLSVYPESDQGLFAQFIIEVSKKLKEQKRGTFITLMPLTGNKFGGWGYEEHYKHQEKELASVGVIHKVVNTTPYYLADLLLQSSINTMAPSFRKELLANFADLRTSTSLKFDDQKKLLLAKDKAEEDIVNEAIQKLTH